VQFLQAQMADGLIAHTKFLYASLTVSSSQCFD
jgi:hypothetical protein